jgi:tRNA(Ile)-lysidine synthase
LAGIPAHRPLGGSRARLIRPLLETRRAEIEAFCRRHGLAWRTDETNADTGYRRNFVRHELLPLLRAHLNPAVDDAVLRLAGFAAEAEAHLAELGAAALDRARVEQSPARLVLDAAALAAEHRLPRTYALRAALERLGAPLGGLTAGHLAALATLPAAGPPAAVALPGGWLARREATKLVIEPAGGGPADGPAPEVPLACPGVTELADGRRVLCELLPFSEVDFVGHCVRHVEGVELLDAGRIRGALVCRQRREGDAFVPLGGPGRQTVSDFLTNARLHRSRRQDVLCIAD